MSDRSYDVVLVGGGSNGLVVANYLAMNGMKVGVFEERWELGGGGCSEEYTAPGFISNPCSTSMRFPHFPPYKDFKLRDYGLKFIYPWQNGSAIFDNDNYIITHPCYMIDEKTDEPVEVPEGPEANYKEIAKVSERDADRNERLRELNEKYWRAAFLESLLNPPPPPGEKNAIEKLIDVPAAEFDPRYRFMTVGEIAYDLYDSPEMRNYWMRSAASFCGMLPNMTIGLTSLATAIMQLIGGSPAGITVGGTHSIVHSLQRFLSTHGGEFWAHSPVRKILIENGKAKGVRLEDGTEIEAKKMVISNLDPAQTVELMGEENVSEEIRRKVKNLDSSGSCIYWGSIALHEEPQYRAAKIDPNVVTFRGYLLTADDYYFRYKWPAEIFSQGYGSRPGLHPYHQSTFDPDRAPAGKYEIHFELYAPPAGYWTLREWLKKKEEAFEGMLKWWQKFAPNMTWDNIIAVHFNCPYETNMRNSAMPEGSWSQISESASQSDQLRPLPELSRYRMPVENIYMCSVSTHPKGMMSGVSGYNCYKIVAEDFGLRKIWEENGRPY
jgi:phytoene dehydrogenase-like protein